MRRRLVARSDIPHRSCLLLPPVAADVEVVVPVAAAGNAAQAAELSPLKVSASPSNKGEVGKQTIFRAKCVNISKTVSPKTVLITNQ